MKSLECYRDPCTRTTTLKMEIPDHGYYIESALIPEIVRIFAKRYVEENYQRLAAELNPVALTNLSIAQAAAEIKNTLQKKLPDKILEIHHHRRW